MNNMISTVFMLVAFVSIVWAGADYSPLAVGNHWESSGTAVYNGNTITTKDSVVLVSDTLIGGMLFYKEEMHEHWSMGPIPILDTVMHNLVTDSGSNKVVRVFADGTILESGYHHPESVNGWDFVGDLKVGDTTYSNCYSFGRGDTSGYAAPGVGIVKIHINDTANSTVYDRELYKYYAVSTDGINTLSPNFTKSNSLFNVDYKNAVVTFKPINREKLSVGIYNALGRRIFFMNTIDSKVLSLQKLSLPSGNYVLKVSGKTLVERESFRLMK